MNPGDFKSATCPFMAEFQCVNFTGKKKIPFHFTDPASFSPGQWCAEAGRAGGLLLYSVRYTLGSAFSAL